MSDKRTRQNQKRAKLKARLNARSRYITDNPAINEFADIAFPDDPRVLTDDLYVELRGLGGKFLELKKEDFDYLKSQGAVYNPARESFIFPVESSFEDDNHTELNTEIMNSNEKVIMELFGYVDSEPLSESLVRELLIQGWMPSIFEKIQRIGIRCEHGGIEAYYSKKRKSLLVPGKERFQTIEFLKNGDLKEHKLPSNFGL